MRPSPTKALGLVLLMMLVVGPLAASEGQTGFTQAPMPRVAIETSMGTILVELDSLRAPKTVKNFLGYVERGFYEGTIFHRVIPGFMIQGGGFDEELQLQPPAGKLENEADNGLSNERGTIAMARQNDPHTATCQFFINHVDNMGLDHQSKASGRSWGYAVFGKVIEGMDVVDAIAEVATERGPKGMSNVPIQPVLITKATWINGPPGKTPAAGQEESLDPSGKVERR